MSWDRASSAAAFTALPVVKVPRWAKAPRSKGVTSVSPAMMVISVGSMPSTSAAMIAIVVWEPCPMSGIPVSSDTVPSSATFRKAADVSCLYIP